MSTIVLPDHYLIRHPPIIRRIAAPLLVNGGAVTTDGDLKLMTFYLCAGLGRPAEEVLSLALKAEDFARTLIVASVQFLPEILSVDRAMH
jgi:hypothetical protein